MRPVLIVIILVFVSHSRSTAQDSLYDGGSRFVCGFARIEKGAQTFYIDSSGKTVFDTILNITDYYSLPFDESTEINTEEESQELLPEKFVLVSLKGKTGVLTTHGKWLLRPLYDTIDTRGRAEWTVTQDDKRSLFTSSGFLLPFRFEDINYMDGDHFDVKQNGKWGIYSKKGNSIILPFEYDEFDYCYGCEQKSDYAYARKNGKWGIVNFKSEVLVPFEYEHEHINMRSDEWVQSFYKNGQHVVINLKTGKVDTCDCDPSEDEPEIMAGGFVRRKQNGKWGMLNTQGKLVLDYKYDFLRYDADNSGDNLPAPYVGLNREGRFGVADTSGRIIIPAIYSDWFSLGYNARVFSSTQNGKDILLGLDGNPVLPAGYNKPEPLKLGRDDDPKAITLVKLVKNNLYGFYNPETKKLVAPQYTNLDNGPYSDLLTVGYKGKKGIIDANGNEVAPIQFDEINTSLLGQRGLVCVVQSKKMGVFDLQQKKLIIPAAYAYIYGVPQDTSLITLTGKDLVGLANPSGKVVCPVKYNNITYLDDGYFLLEQDDSNQAKRTYSLFAASTARISLLPYDTLQPANEGVWLIVTDKGKQKLLDPATGKMAGGEYAGISGFNNGISMVLKEQDSSTDRLLFGFMDSTGRLVTPLLYDFDPDFELSRYFIDDYLLLTKFDQISSSYLQGYAQRNGHLFISPEYSKIIPQKKGKGYLVQKANKFGILDGSGNVVLPVAFEDILLGDQNTMPASIDFPLLAKINEEWKYYTSDGKALPLRIKANISFLQSAP